MRMVDSIWFNTRQGHFGFVIGEDETTGERNLYGGVVSGFCQAADEQELLDWGTKVSVSIMESLIAKIKAK